jgi:putative MATE family efflux protein
VRLGELDRQIARLALPALAALVAEPLFLLADSLVVGRLGTLPLAGLGVAGSALAAIIGLFVFLAYGTTASVARRLGAGDLRAAMAVGVDGLWLALGLGLVVGVVGALLAEPVVAGLGASPGVTPFAVTYLRWSLPGLPAMLVVLAATGVLRGMQDTRTPLRVAVVGALANAGLNVLLVHGLDRGIAGSGLGTSLAQVGMAGALLRVVGRGARAQGVPLRPHLPGVRACATAGVPLLLRTLTLRAALLVTTAVAARQGDAALAGHQVVFTLWTFAQFALDAIAIAGQALTGKALGAGSAAEARAALQRMLAWGLWAGLGLGLLLLGTGWLLAPAFSASPEVQDAITSALVVVALSLPLAGWVFVLDGVLIGAGDGRYLALAGLLVLVAYLPLAAAVGLTAPGGTTGLVWLWVVFGFGFMGARAVTLGRRARGDVWLVTGV